MIKANTLRPNPDFNSISDLIYRSLVNVPTNEMIRKNLGKERKAISPIIATLLLILIAIAAGVIVYAYVVGFLTSNSPSPSQVGTDQLAVNAVSYTRSSTTVTAYVQNVGQNSLNATMLYIYFANGTLAQALSYTSWNPGKQVQISAGTTGSIVATASLTSGLTYYAKVTTLTGSAATSSDFKA